MSAQRLRFRVPRPRGLIGYLATLAAIITINFFLPRLMPGDPLHALVDPSSPTYVSDKAMRGSLAAYYGLNQSLIAQFWTYFTGLFRGNFGQSISANLPVGTLVLGALPWTLLLVATSLLLSTVVGVVGGIHSAWRRGRPADRGLLTMFLGISNVATYVVATIAVIIFAIDLKWFPIAGAQAQVTDSITVPPGIDILYHLALPAFVLSLGFMTESYLLMRGGMVTELGSRYLLLGRAKGLSNRRLMYAHAARNAMLPVVTLVALQLGVAVGTTVFVEAVFQYPGIGGQLASAIASRDYPLLQGCLLVLAVVVVTGNFAADKLYRRLDPRTAVAA